MLNKSLFSLYCAICKPTAFNEALKEAKSLSAAELDERIQSVEPTITKLRAKGKQLSPDKNSILAASLSTRRCSLAAYQKVRRQKKK